MKTKLISLQNASGFFRDGMTIMIGGFMGVAPRPALWKPCLNPASET